MALIKPNLTKPNIGGDIDVWGDKLNINVDSQDMYNRQIADDSSFKEQELYRLEAEKVSTSTVVNLIEEQIDDYFESNIEPTLKSITDIVYEFEDDIATINDEKFDNVEVEGTRMNFMANGVIRKSIPVPSGGGGGAGGGATLMKVSKVNNPSLVGAGSVVELIYSFTSIDPTTNTPTGDCSVMYSVNNKSVYRGTKSQSEDIIFNVTEFIVVGQNTVKITVTDDYGTSRALEYNIEAIAVELKSRFDSSVPYYDEFDFYLTPVGKIEKDVFIQIDENEPIVAKNNTTGIEISFKIPKQSHGLHKIKAYFSCNAEGNVLTSNVLEFEVLCVEESNPTVIYKIKPSTVNPVQYGKVDVSYLIYNQESEEVSVEIYSNGTLVSTQIGGRTTKTYTHKFNTFGLNYLKFSFCGTEELIEFDVSELGIDLNPVTTDLELQLTAEGKSNSDLNKNTWVYNDIVSTLTNFNFNTNGWLSDDDENPCLRINSGATVEIPFKVFSKDLKTNGKTIEFEFKTTRVEDYDDSIIECLVGGKGIVINPQLAKISSDLSHVSTQYKEAQRIKVTFVIQKSREDRLLILYSNGVLTGVTQYPTNDSFLQSTPQGIVLKANKCNLDVYNIRVYDNSLTEYQVLSNHMFDTPNIDDKIEMFNKNNIYNSVNEIEYNKVIEYIPCMTIIGKLPAFKGDKLKNKVVYENRQDPSKSFSAENVGNDVQGTSSQYYPRKNFKLKIDKKAGLTMTESYEKLMKYQLRDGEIPIRTICLKADFAESSSTHNTGIAKIMNDTLIAMDILTPPQEVQKASGKPINYRTCVDGFPIIVFSQEDETSERVFLGKYNFNADKGNDDYYGFLEAEYPNCECIELLNNNSERTVFRRSDFDEMGEKEGVPYAKWFDDFEFRYPDNDDMNAAFEDGSLKPVQFKRLTDWLATTTDNPEKFRAEYKDYFHEDFLIFYHCITELFAMVDQRAKNLFLTTWDGLKWYSIFYDNDTVFGLDNNGLIKFGFGVEYQDKQEGLSVWNDKMLSNIWANVDKAFPAEIKKMYKRIRETVGYDYVIDYMNKQQSDKWSESIYNEDAKFKYVLPLTEGYYDGYTQSFKKTGEYLPRAQGSRAEHRKWWLANRFHYIDSKYNEGQYTGDYITMRVNMPTLIENPSSPEEHEINNEIRATLIAVPSDTGFNITSFVDQYARVKYEHTEVSARGYKNKEVRLNPPENFVFSDTNTILYGASRLNDLGDLAPKYPSYLSLAGAINLINLKIGSDKVGYKNRNLKNLTLGNNGLLRTLDIRNCTGLSQSLDLTGCINLQEIYAGGTALTYIGLPNGGILTKLQTPSTLKSLTVTGHKELTKIESQGYKEMKTLILQGNTKLENGVILSDILLSADSLEKVRVINLNDDGYFAEDMLVKLLEKCAGFDSNGSEVTIPVLEGKLRVFTSDLNSDKKYIEEKFPNLKITWIEMKGYDFEPTEVDGVLGYAISANSELQLDGNGQITIPTTYGGLNVIEIKDFSNNPYLRRINKIDSNNVLKITKGALINTGIRGFVLGNSIKYLDLSDCGQVIEINGLSNELNLDNHPSIKKIDLANTGIFKFKLINCSNLEYLNIGESTPNTQLEVTNCKNHDNYVGFIQKFAENTMFDTLKLDNLNNDELDEVLQEHEGWIPNIALNCNKYVLTGMLKYKEGEFYVFDEVAFSEKYPNIKIILVLVPNTLGYEVEVLDLYGMKEERVVNLDVYSNKRFEVKWGEDVGTTDRIENFGFSVVRSEETEGTGVELFDVTRVSHEYTSAKEYTIRIENCSEATVEPVDTLVEFNDIFVDEFTYEIDKFYRLNPVLKKATIPSRVLHLGDRAFENSSITNMDLSTSNPKNLNRLVSGCSKLTTLSLPKTLNDTEYMSSIVEGCDNLVQINLPASIPNLKNSLVETNLNETTFPKRVISFYEDLDIVDKSQINFHENGVSEYTNCDVDYSKLSNLLGLYLTDKFRNECLVESLGFALNKRTMENVYDEDLMKITHLKTTSGAIAITKSELSLIPNVLSIDMSDSVVSKLIVPVDLNLEELVIRDVQEEGVVDLSMTDVGSLIVLNGSCLNRILLGDKIRQLFIIDIVPPTLRMGAISKQTKVYVPTGCAERYLKTTNWNAYDIKEK
ncbi:MAG: leucine-rich repeat protein [Fusobacteriaceae bacterium]